MTAFNLFAFFVGPFVCYIETACNDDTDVNIEPTEENENNPQTPSKRENGFALPSVGREMYSFGCVQSPSVKVASAIRTPSIRLRRPTSSVKICSYVGYS